MFLYVLFFIACTPFYQEKLSLVLHAVRCAHYWMSNALNKFYYFVLDVWGYPLIPDSYYPESK